MKFYFIVQTSKEMWHVLWLQIHIMTKELIRLGMTLAHHLPLNLVDNRLVMVANLIFGDLSRYGIRRPKMGPMILKSKTGRSAVIDVGTVGLIKKGIIKVSISLTWHKFHNRCCLHMPSYQYSIHLLQVQGSISKIMGDIVEFQCSKKISFDAIVFATGYKSTANIWLKVTTSIFEYVWVCFLGATIVKSANKLHVVFLSQNGENMLNGNGLPIKEYPNHWKGENGLYCAGLGRRGLAGIAVDAKNIASDIKSVIGTMSG